MADILIEYACQRIVELEALLLMGVPETVRSAEVAMVYSLVESPGRYLCCLHQYIKYT